MRAWLRGLLLHLSGRPRTLVSCLHPSWSACFWGVTWCLRCGYRRKCY